MHETENIKKKRHQLGVWKILNMSILFFQMTLSIFFLVKIIELIYQNMTEELSMTCLNYLTVYTGFFVCQHLIHSKINVLSRDIDRHYIVEEVKTYFTLGGDTFDHQNVSSSR